MCGGRGALSRLGVLCGIAAMGTLLTAFVGGAWLYTREPVTLPNSEITTVLSFRIGLWRICPTVRRPPNFTIHMPAPACSLVKYSGWEDIRHSDLGIWTALEFTPSFVSRMRVSTVFEGTSVILLLLATIFAIIGHCNGDHKTLIACGLYILGDFEWDNNTNVIIALLGLFPPTARERGEAKKESVANTVEEFILHHPIILPVEEALKNKKTNQPLLVAVEPKKKTKADY